MFRSINRHLPAKAPQLPKTKSADKPEFSDFNPKLKEPVGKEKFANKKEIELDLDEEEDSYKPV